MRKCAAAGSCKINCLPLGAVVVGRDTTFVKPDLLNLIENGTAGTIHGLNLEKIAFAWHSPEMTPVYKILNPGFCALSIDSNPGSHLRLLSQYRLCPTKRRVF